MIKDKLRLDTIRNLGLEKTILLISIIIYTILMSSLTILRMYALKSSAWDLGNYNQAMYTFVFHGKMFYMTPDLLNNPSGSLFGVHFSPIFFIQAPIYLLNPRAETLLVIQSFVIALGVIPTYLIACEIFSATKWRMLLSFSYLLNPAVLGINWFDFHPELYIPTFFLFMIYFYMKKRWGGFWTCSLLVLSTIEYAPIMTAIFGLDSILKDILCPFARHKQRHVNKKLLANLVFLIAISLLWLVIASKIMLIYAPENPQIVGKTEHWPTLGASNIQEVPITIILHPDRAIAALIVDANTKILFLIVIFLPWLLLPLFSLSFWISSFYWLIPALLSNNIPFYTIGLQYPCFFIAQTTYYGMTSIKKLSFKMPKVFHLTAAMIIVSLILSNPILSLNVATNRWATYGVPYLSQKTNDVRTLLTYIPPDASVLTNNNIFPLVSSRINAYVIPWQVNYPTASFFSYVDQKVRKVDYIILETDQWWPLTALILSRTKDFGVLGYLDGILLLKRDYHEEPILFRSSVISFNAANETAPRIFLVTGSVTYDNTSQSGEVFRRESYEQIGTDFWWGPWVYLSTPGIYEVTFWLRLGANCSGDIITLDATVFPAKILDKLWGSPITGYYQTIVIDSMQKKLFPEVVIKGEDLDTNNYVPISLNISADIAGYYEFRGINVTASIPVFLDRIDLKMITVLSTIEPVFIQFGNYSSLLFDENHCENIIDIGKLVPNNASLLLQNELFALIAREGVSYPILLDYSQNETTFGTQLEQLFQRVEFIMLDWKSNMTIATEVLSHLTSTDDFGIYAFADDIILLKRHFYEQSVLFKPDTIKFVYKDLESQNGTYIVKDPNSINQFVLVHNKTASDFWWGPYVNLFPGTYQAIFRLKMQNKTESTFLTIEINRFEWKIAINQSSNNLEFETWFTGNKVEVAEKIVTDQDVSIEEEYSTICLNFVVDTFGQFEFPGRYVQIDSEILLDEIVLIMLEPDITLRIP